MLVLILTLLGCLLDQEVPGLYDYCRDVYDAACACATPEVAFLYAEDPDYVCTLDAEYLHSRCVNTVAMYQDDAEWQASLACYSNMVADTCDAEAAIEACF